MDKLQLRSHIKQLVTELDARVREAKSKKACQNLIAMPEYRKASVVMVFLSLTHEVDTTSIILDAWQNGKTVAVPKVSWQQRHMIPIELNSLESGISVSSHGLRNPTTGMPVPVEDIDIVVAPGLAFDEKGGRLGRGGAYYDRFFASAGLYAKRFGLAFDEQLVEEVPMEEHDQALNAIVTDKKIIKV